MKTFKIIAILLTAGIFGLLPQPSWAAEPQSKTAIEVKMGIRSLALSGKKVMVLDVSKNTALTSLDCSGNQLSSRLDVSGCTALASLDCSGNQLSGLDVSGCMALERLVCDNNQLTGLLDVSKNTALESLSCRYNHIPLSGLYETYSGIPSNDVEYYIEGQSDSIVLLVGENLDLSSERRIGDRFSTYKVKDKTGNELPSYLYEEQGFVFRFSDAYNYRLEIQNPSVSTNNISDDYFSSDDDVRDVTFTWHITVLESLADYLTVQVAANHAEWGRVGVSGNGRFKAGTAATVTATPNVGYRFVSWTKKDGAVLSTQATYTFTVTENMELTANFAEQATENYTVLLLANNNDYGRVSQTGSGMYREGTEVTITATANEGYRFVNWTKKNGSVFATEAVHTFTVTENIELTAHFEKRPEDVDTYTVLLSANNNDYGRVSQTGDGTYEAGEEVTITATAKTGCKFINWTKKDGSVFATEAVHTFTVTENMELTAHFGQQEPETPTYTVLLSVNQSAWGDVFQSGGGLYKEGEKATIVAMPKAGCNFISWTKKDGTVFSTQAVYTFTVTEDVDLTANFGQPNRETHTVLVSVNQPAWGNGFQLGGGIYEEGEQATVIAMANAGYRFVNWTKKNGSVFSTDAIYTFTVTEDLELTANFEQIVGNEDLTEDKLYVYVKDHTIHLSEERGLVRVYNAAGVCVYSGQSTAIPVHSGGLYIVHVGARAYKAVVR